MRVPAALFLIAAAAFAQVPGDTPVGKLFNTWLRNMNNGDQTAIERFIATSMPWGKLEQELGIRQQTGGFDVRKVETSTPNHLDVLAQERGPAAQFVRISMDADASGKVAGIQIQPTDPPANMAPPALTADQLAAAKDGAPYRKFQLYLEAHNSGNRDRIGQFLQTHFPGRDLNREMSYREATGGLDLRLIERASLTSLTGIVQHREDPGVFARFTITVDAVPPHPIKDLRIAAAQRPAGIPAPARLTDADLAAALRTRIEKETAAGRFSGAVLVTHEGRTIFSGAYGMADRERAIANTLDTKFRIGSMNKMFTAVAILQLAQAGRLQLQDPVGKYIRDYPNPEVASKVTIYQLLTHTGGTGDIFGPEFEQRRLSLRTLNDYVQLYGNRPPAFTPGSRFAYSNYGMLLLGVVIERVSGMSYYDYVARNIYARAGMSSTGSEPEATPVAGRATGYLRDGKPNTDTLPYRGTSAGGGYSTVRDLLRFADALMSNQLLDAARTKELMEGKIDAGPGAKYAFGFEDARDKDGNGAVGHGGGAPGMNGDLRIYPKSGYVVIVLANQDPPAAASISGYLDSRLAK